MTDLSRLPSFRLDKDDFLRGNNTYDNMPDGEFLAQNNGLNPFHKPGTLTIPSSVGAPTTGLPSAGMINFGKGKGTLTLDAIAVGTNSSQDGYFFTIADSTGAHTQVGSADTAHNYDIGKSDTEFYQGSLYTTSDTDITKNNLALTVRDTVYWVTTLGKSALTATAPHPEVVYNDILYIADGRYLHQIDGATGTAQVFDLGPDWVITALANYNDLIYITAEPYYNFGGSNHSQAKMVTWDGYSASWISEWKTEFRIGALYVSNNILYAWSKDYMYYWNGIEMKPLRPMSGQIYKHQITEVDRSIFFVDGTYVVRYGSPLFGGAKKFFYYYNFGTNLAGIISYYNKSMVISQTGVSTSQIGYATDVNSPSTSAVYEVTGNKRFFKRPVRPRACVVETLPLVSGNSLTMKYVSDKGVEKTCGATAFSYALHGGAYLHVFDILNAPSTRVIQPRIRITGNLYIVNIDYFYEPVEVLTTT